MAVAFQAKGSSATTSVAATSTTFTKLTVASGSNLALLVGIVFGGDPGAFTVANWDNTGTPQALTQIGSASATDNLSKAYLFGLVNPTLGAKTLAFTWTNSVDFCYDAVSFTGVDQTGGATTFKNFNSAQTSTAPPSVAVTSPSGDMAAACFGTSAAAFATGGLGTEVYFDNTNVSASMRYLLGVGSTTLQQTASGNFPFIAVGCDLAAAVAAGLVPYEPWRQRGPILAQ